MNREGQSALATIPGLPDAPLPGASPYPSGWSILAAMSDAPLGSPRPSPFEALAAVARTLGETLEMRQVFARVAAAARTALPFERMRVILIEGDALRMYATEHDGAPGKEDGSVVPMADCSPAFWHDLVVERIDVRRQLDPSFRWDRETIESGYRSVIRAKLRSGGRNLGLLGFGSRQPEAFTEEHESIVLALADLVAAALEHERMWTEEHRRRERGDALERLLPTLAKSMDIREIFRQISEVSQDVICHDIVGLSFLSADGKSLPVYALSDGRVDHLADPPALPDRMRSLARGFFIMRDITVVDRATRRVRQSALSADRGPLPPQEAEIDPTRFWLVAEKGIRSWVSVPLRSQGEVSGVMLFGSRRPNAYDPHDADLAGRVADHVALALAYQRMAEEARRAEEARAKAAALETRVESLTSEIEAISGYGRVVGESATWKAALRLATQVAATEATVLLLGESGTGKEVIARYVHRASARAGGPYVALNCAALPEHLLESELFGFERGAFTGAAQAKPGQIERAAGGVLFLDEVAEMTLSAQAKFLRVLQEREFQRLGGTRTLTADVRVIAATNRDLRAAIERGTFREDLYYRLQVFEIRLPPLRERPEDILPLSDAFLADLSRGFARPPAGVSREARERLMEYSWPGNVRELRNILERAAILCDGGLISAEHLALPAPRAGGAASRAVEGGLADARPAAAVPSGSDLMNAERAIVEKAMKDALYNKSKAARALGLTRTQLYVRLRRHGLA
jgi:transcriptional regulator with GAF, ATPase, and Fis domain